MIQGRDRGVKNGGKMPEKVRSEPNLKRQNKLFVNTARVDGYHPRLLYLVHWVKLLEQTAENVSLDAA